MPKELIELELACQRAGHEGDGERLHEIWAETGFLAHPDRFRPDKLLAQFRDATWWYVLDEEIELRPEIATQVMIDMSDPRSEHFGQMRHETLPADHLFGRRVEMLTLAVLSQLRATLNFHRIAREWMYGDPPVTELGRQEAAFYGPEMADRLPPRRAGRGGGGGVRARRARGDLSSERVRGWVDDAGVWAPVAFVVGLRLADGRVLPRAAAGRRERAAVRHRARLPAQPVRRRCSAPRRRS